MWDGLSIAVFQHWQAGNEAATRDGLEAILAEELAQLEPASSFRRQRADFYRGSLNWQTGEPLEMQYLGDRAEVDHDVRYLLQGDLFFISRGFDPEPQDEELQEKEPLSPRQWLRRATVAADFMVWFNSNDGEQELQRVARMTKRGNLDVNLSPEDAAQEAYRRIMSMKTLPYSRGLIKTTMKSVFKDARRRSSHRYEVSVDGDDKWGNERGDDTYQHAIEQYAAGQDYTEEYKLGQRPFYPSCPDHTQDQVFTLLRKRQLFGLLEEVRQSIPGMEIILFRSPPKKLTLCNGYKQWLVFGSVKQRKLKIDHQRLFAMWTSLLPSARFDAELTVREIAEQNNYSEATVKRLFSDLQTALSQHPRYDELLELMLPIRYRGPVPGDVRAFFDQLIREERCKFQQLMGQWRDELNDAEKLFV